MARSSTAGTSRLIRLSLEVEAEVVVAVDSVVEVGVMVAVVDTTAEREEAAHHTLVVDTAVRGPVAEEVEVDTMEVVVMEEAAVEAVEVEEGTEVVEIGAGGKTAAEAVVMMLKNRVF